jgi:hypothetical protein
MFKRLLINKIKIMIKLKILKVKLHFPFVEFTLNTIKLSFVVFKILLQNLSQVFISYNSFYSVSLNKKIQSIVLFSFTNKLNRYIIIYKLCVYNFTYIGYFCTQSLCNILE